jgi:hypothetical protein
MGCRMKQRMTTSGFANCLLGKVARYFLTQNTKTGENVPKDLKITK